jgi:NADPH:quinone reductase-like Zn-dependent oxidoreductase
VPPPPLAPSRSPLLRARHRGSCGVRACLGGGPERGFDTLRIATRPLRAPGRGEVLVDVHMSGIAARDQGVVRGWFLEDKPPTLIPLSEGVGTVCRSARMSITSKVGDRVTCVHFARWISGPWSRRTIAVDVGNTVDGWLGERVVLPASGRAASRRLSATPPRPP